MNKEKNKWALMESHEPVPAWHVVEVDRAYSSIALFYDKEKADEYVEWLNLLHWLDMNYGVTED